MSAVLELHGIDKSYRLPTGERLNVLDDLDLTIDEGECVAIIGRSGSGKSTLLNILGLLDNPTKGSFMCAGKDANALSDSSRSRLRGEFFGFVFQQFFLLDRRTALENVAEPLLLAAPRDIASRVHRSMDLLRQVGLADRSKSMPHLLSGGEQQRVAIARALVRHPRVVLADELTGSLDETTSDAILELLLDSTKARGTSLIIVTHDRQVADRADRTLVLSGGKLHGKEVR